MLGLFTALACSRVVLDVPDASAFPQPDGGPTCGATAQHPAAVGPIDAESVWALGDLRQTGSTDLAMTNVGSPSGGTGCTVSVALRLVDGSFSVPPSAGGPSVGCLSGASSNTSEVWSSDVDGDGNLDVWVLSPDPFWLMLFYGDGHGAFREGGGPGNFFGPTDFGREGIPRYGTSGNFHGDGTQDLAVEVIGDGGAGLYERLFLIRNRNPEFDLGESFDVDVTSAVAPWLVAGDFNGDGIEDLVRLSGSGQLTLFAGGSVVTAGPSMDLTGADAGAPSGLVVGSVFSDAGCDLFVALADRLEVLRCLGDGGFAIAATLEPAPASTTYRYGWPALVDWNGDGRNDLAVTWEEAETGFDELGDVQIFLQTPDGGFCGPFVIEGAETSLAALTQPANLPALAAHDYSLADPPQLLRP